MYDPTPNAVPAPERLPAAMGPRRPARSPQSTQRQNAMGDLVIPLERGEIVTLPRLWGFALDELSEARAVLHGPGGLTAEVALVPGGAVVEHIAPVARPLAGAA